jgi:hypothetical protein
MPEKASFACASSFLPINLGADFEQVRMDSIEIGPVEWRRILEHIDSVRHKADPFVGMPI